MKLYRCPFKVLILLAISGISALGYELCWIRLGTIQYGSTISAFSTVVAAFFTGIALGSYLFGKVSVSARRLVLLYGSIEVLIGVCAFLTFQLLQWSDIPFGILYKHLNDTTPVLLLLRSVLIFIIIMPTSILIGGVFPLVCQFSVAHSSYADKNWGALMYASNTLGAFAGCILAGTILIPELGLAKTNIIFCGLSIGLGVLVLIVRKSILKEVGENEKAIPLELTIDTQKEIVPLKTSAPQWFMYSIFFFTGFAALGMEILWTRFLSLVIHTTAYTYVFSLATILLGIAVGSILKNFLPKNISSAFVFGIINFLIGITIVLILLRPVYFWDWINESTDLFEQILFCISVFIVPSILMGISFPLAMEIVNTQPGKYGKQIGTLFSANTFGGILGSVSVGFVFLPILGMHNTLVFLTQVSIVSGCAVILVTKEISLKRRAAICISGTALWVIALLIGQVRLPDHFLGREGNLLAVREGVASFLSVLDREDEIRLEIDGMWQGQKHNDYQVMTAHIPMVLHQNPKRILVIGLGAGQTCQSFLKYNIERLDYADIERNLPDLLREYFDGKWLDDARAHFIAEDGRTVVSHSAEKYDIISIEVGQTFRPQVALLYTADFYSKVKTRLNPNGLACQFVPVGFFSEPEFSSVIRSFLEVFPNSTLWFNKYAEFILIGSPNCQLSITEKRWTTVLSNTEVLKEFLNRFDKMPWEQDELLENFSAYYLMGSNGLNKLADNGVVYRDDQPILEYRTAIIEYAPKRFHKTIENKLEDPILILEPTIQTAIDHYQCTKIRRENVHSVLSK